jgi:Flp pilus assembly protein TadD
MGFASFVAGDIGQNFLKAGYCPYACLLERLYLKQSLMRMKMNKSNKVKMNKFKILSVAFLATVSGMNAQDIDQAKKAIDAEQFENAKSTLKSIIKSDPSEGKAYFLLGNVYLAQVADSAKMTYQKV